MVDSCKVRSGLANRFLDIYLKILYKNLLLILEVIGHMYGLRLDTYESPKDIVILSPVRSVVLL